MHQHPVWPYARISAHRGGGTLAPENTLEAFRTGLRCGFAAMETDAMLAKDGVPILMHDEVFGRTIRDRQGSVPELTSLEVNAFLLSLLQKQPILKESHWYLTWEEPIIGWQS